VVDTSAAMAILTDEPAAEALTEHLAHASPRLMSSGTLVELGVVLESRVGPAASGLLDRFLRDGGIDLVPVEREHVDRALEGWRRFGRGRHPAALNLGDLFAYGLAVATGHPVLCTGDDFVQTDVETLRAV
jgi:ribonuclease VapC